MGRNKIQIKKIASTGGRQITYSKRRAGLFKKARELSILCDVDALLVVFSTKGEPSVCLGEKSKFEDVIIRYSEKSAEERHKRKREVIEALRNAFKKKDPEVNIDELYDADSQLVEEAKQRELACYRDEITRLSNFLGPLSEFEDLKKIEDINKIIEMEQKINDFIAQIRVSKENANNYAQIVQSMMNQSYQLNGELGSLQYSTIPGSKQIMIPCNPMASHQSRDLAKFNTSYEAPINYAQDIIWTQMFENQQINTNELLGLMHLPRKKPLCVEGVKMAVMPENKGDVSENLNENQNRSMCQGQEETHNISAVSEAGVLQLQEMSGNGKEDLLDNFFEQKMFFRKDIVNQEVPMQDSCFQAWASGDDA